jgi:hypothetical protein
MSFEILIFKFNPSTHLFTIAFFLKQFYSFFPDRRIKSFIKNTILEFFLILALSKVINSSVLELRVLLKVIYYLQLLSYFRYNQYKNIKFVYL